jgi:hypothetical protein
MADLTPERRAEIREREQATIPGPWTVVDDEHTVERWIRSEDGTLEVGLGYLGNRTETEAAFIAHARQDVPDLLDEVERLTAGIRVLYTRCMQGARDNGEYYERTAAKYEQGKAVVWDGVAEMLRELLPALDEPEADRG